MEKEFTYDVHPGLIDSDVASALGLLLGPRPQGLYTVLLDWTGNGVANLLDDGPFPLQVLVFGEERNALLFPRLEQIATPA